MCIRDRFVPLHLPVGRASVSVTTAATAGNKTSNSVDFWVTGSPVQGEECEEGEEDCPDPPGGSGDSEDSEDEEESGSSGEGEGEDGPEEGE